VVSKELCCSISQHDILNPGFFVINISEELMKCLSLIQPSSSVCSQRLHSMDHTQTHYLREQSMYSNHSVDWWHSFNT